MRLSNLSASILFLHSLLFSVALGQGNDYLHKIYTTDDGLSHNHVRTIAQDKEGYLWIATWDGLSRFDGYEFRNYRHNPFDSTSVPYLEVNGLIVDKYNNLWILGGTSLARYDRAKDRFIRYSARYFAEPENSVSDIFSDQGNNLMVLGYSHLYIYNGKKDQFQQLSFVNGSDFIKKNNLGLAFFDNLNHLWLGNETTLYPCQFVSTDSLNFREGSEHSVKYSLEFVGSSNFVPLSRIFISAAGNYYLAGNSGLYRLDKSRNCYVRTDNIAASESFSGVEKINWCDPGKGIRIFDIKCKKLNSFSFPFNVDLPFIDREGNLWFGGISGKDEGIGLHCLIKTPGYFRHYMQESQFRDNNNVYSLIKDSRKNVWAGLKMADYLIQVMPDGLTRKRKLISSDKSKEGGHPRSFLELPRGNLWIGYYNKLLCRYNLDRSTAEVALEYLFPRPLNKNPADFRVMAMLDSNRIVFSGDHFLAIYHLLSGKIEKSTEISYPVYAMHIAEDRSIWVGSSQCKLAHFTAGLSPEKEYSVPPASFNIESIEPDSSGGFWLAMLGGGLCHFNPGNGSARYFTTSQGLSNNTVYSIQKDKKGRLWLSTDLGINCFDPASNSIRSFGISDGLKITEFNSDASFRSPDGEILMGGMGGFVGFYPDSIFQKQAMVSFPLLISSISVSGEQVYSDKPIYELCRIRLEKGTSNFNLRFFSPDLTHAAQVRYRYQLKGIDHGWQPADTKLRMVNYSGLTPGTYNFLVECTDRSGNWAHHKILTIIIPPFFYQTLIFKVTLILFLLMMVYLFLRMFLRQMKTREQKRQEQLKLEAIQSQMNPHFIYNSLNSINYFISISDKARANQYLSDFSMLMRAILNNSSKEYIPLEKEIELIDSYLKLEKLRFSDKFDYVIEADPALNPVDLEVAPSLVQPFVENSVWHGLRRLEDRKGNIRIRFLPGNADQIVCEIEDDGIGVSRSVELKSEDQRQRRSRGIGLIHERLRIINLLRNKKYNFSIEPLYPDRTETGTKVTVLIPVKPEK